MTNSRWDDFGDRASARRAAARSLHPDVGGDATLFTAALAEIDRRFGDGGAVGARRPEPATIIIRRSRRGAMQARMRTLRRHFRRGGKLPLGRRRYPSL